MHIISVLPPRREQKSWDWPKHHQILFFKRLCCGVLGLSFDFCASSAHPQCCSLSQIYWLSWFWPLLQEILSPYLPVPCPAINLVPTQPPSTPPPSNLSPPAPTIGSAPAPFSRMWGSSRDSSLPSAAPQALCCRRKAGRSNGTILSMFLTGGEEEEEAELCQTTGLFANGE